MLCPFSGYHLRVTAPAQNASVRTQRHSVDCDGGTLLSSLPTKSDVGEGQVPTFLKRSTGDARHIFPRATRSVQSASPVSLLIALTLASQNVYSGMSVTPTIEATLVTGFL